VDRSAFLDQLRQSRLLSGEQLHGLASRFGEDAPAHLVASALVEEGVLTRFQAKQLWAGKARGLVLGQYRIIDELGKGGFGKVFQALHTLMDRVVAIKVIAPELVEDAQARSMFHREVLASTQLGHPNIVMAYDANEVDDVLFLVMEYIDGPNLDAFIKEQGPLPVGLACEVMRQAALGLQHANDKGMVHRDIKPGNLLLPRVAWAGAAVAEAPDGGAQPGTPAPLIKVVDFGLARLHRSATAGTLMLENEKSFLGTPDYVSPEQARNLHAVDIRSDLYSLGCTLYFALSARRPFRGTTVMEVVVKHLEKEPEPLEVVRPDVPPGVCAIVRRLMAKDPEQRFQTPAELVAALVPFCEVTTAALASCVSLSGANSAGPLPAWAPGPGNAATALVPDLAFWQGPERIRPDDRESVAPRQRPALLPAAREVVGQQRLLQPPPDLRQLPPPAVGAAPSAPPGNGLAPATKPDGGHGHPAACTPDGNCPEGSSSQAPYHASAALRKCWEQWVTVVEAFVQSEHPQVNEPAYRAVHAALLEHCRKQDYLAAGSRPMVLARIEAIVEPWLAPHTFVSTDRQNLAGLLARCGAISQELGLHARSWKWGWLGGPVLIGAAAVGIMHLERTQHLTAKLTPWSECLRSLVMAYPLPSLGIAAAAVVLVSMFTLSRLLRK